MLVLTREFMVATIRMLAAKDDVVVAADFAGKGENGRPVRLHPFLFAALEFASWQDNPAGRIRIAGQSLSIR